MKNQLLIFSFIILPAFCFSQNRSDTDKESGKLQLGVRSTFSSFTDAGHNGLGTGGQFRLKLGNRLNTEWFADYIKTNIASLAMRTDYHIGWAVQYYPLNNIIQQGQLTPYIMAGHCFDKTEVEKTYGNDGPLSRWSSAVTSGLGTHYNITDNFDISLSGLYMLHLGDEIHVAVSESGNEAEIEEEDAHLGGHLLFSLSLNVYMGDLWGKQVSN
ncbi:MAG: hypothetical protein SH856_04695 [Flavobacteriales bacterium]|nr:hypothetical protein [Flavobacteriales bacterium]